MQSLRGVIDQISKITRLEEKDIEELAAETRDISRDVSRLGELDEELFQQIQRIKDEIDNIEEEIEELKSNYSQNGASFQTVFEAENIVSTLKKINENHIDFVISELKRQKKAINKIDRYEEKVDQTLSELQKLDERVGNLKFDVGRSQVEGPKLEGFDEAEYQKWKREKLNAT